MNMQQPEQLDVRQAPRQKGEVLDENPVRTAPWPPWPVFNAKAIAAATAVLRSGRVNYWTGEEGRRFEEEFAASCGCRYGVALANGTVALELALYALGIGSGDEVIVPSRTFIASASAVVMRGARPVVADVDPVSQNLTAESVRRVLTPRTRAIVAVHLAGWPCDMQPLAALACEFGLKLIEDCAQAHGATYRGKPVGSLGHVAAFSFCQDKILSTGGEGGMLTTNDRGVWERAWTFKDHGKSHAATEQRQPSASFRWLHDSFGTNWRMTEMQASIGRTLLPRLPEWVARRRRNAALLTKGFRELPLLRVTEPPAEIGHAYYKYYAFLRPERLRYGWGRDRVIQAIAAEGVPCFCGSCSEIYLERAFRDVGLTPVARLPIAQQLGATSLMFQVHPTLGDAEMQDTVAVVTKVLRQAEEKRRLVRQIH